MFKFSRPSAMLLAAAALLLAPGPIAAQPSPEQAPEEAVASDNAPLLSGEEDRPEAAEEPRPDEPAQESEEDHLPDSATNAPTDPTTESPAEQEAPLPEVVELDRFLAVPAVGRYGRAALQIDPVEAAIARGEWSPPAVGDVVTDFRGIPRKWRALAADDTGHLEASEYVGGYAVAVVDSPADRVMLLEASGHAAVCVGGAWLAGDPYGYGWLRVPVELRKGANWLLFHVARPNLSARLVQPKSDYSFLAGDVLVPDLVADEAGQPSEGEWAAIPIINATRGVLRNAVIECRIGEGEPALSEVPRIDSLTVHKAKFKLPSPLQGAHDHVTLRVRLLRHERTEVNVESPELELLSETALGLRIVGPHDRRTQTFISRIDGSVQRYAVIPAAPAAGVSEPPGMLLALHDIAVPCEEFAARFKAKSWAHIVAPENRRPYGFDWEDWGAIDAEEALADARQRFPSDPLKTYVLGHGMGGHGALLLAARRPSKFAAAGTIGGWLSYRTTGGSLAEQDATPVDEMVARPAVVNDPGPLLQNLSSLGLYVMHGSDDTMANVAESRHLRLRLGEFHTDFAYDERQGDGHWWGDATVDAPRIMQFFQDRSAKAPGEVDSIDFTTTSPSVASGDDWAEISAQATPLAPSRMVLTRDRDKRLLTGRTENISRLAIDSNAFSQPGLIRVQLDSSEEIRAAAPGRGQKLWLSKTEAGWRRTSPPSASSKSPQRNGGLKSAFDNNALLVYGTSGTVEENRWAAEKARFDSQSFWTRGGGSLEVMPDREFDADADRDRNIVLYGNADTNAAWPALLSTCPVQVRRGRVYVDIRPQTGDDTAVAFIRPRPRSATATVAVIGGSGPVGMRLTTRMRYFVSGVAYPDFIMFGPEAISDRAESVQAAGFFGQDWSIEAGEFAWREVAL